SGLSLILSALGAALGTERLCIHLVSAEAAGPGQSSTEAGGPGQSSAEAGGPGQSSTADRTLQCAAYLGFDPGQLEPWARLRFGPVGGPIGMAAADERPVIADNMRAWRSFRDLARDAKIASAWSVPVLGPGGLSGLTGVITVFRDEHRTPQRDEL